MDIDDDYRHPDANIIEYALLINKQPFNGYIIPIYGHYFNRELSIH